MSSATVGVVHIAGLHLHVGCLVRQRCAWCGALLLDYDLNSLSAEWGASAEGPPTWEPGAVLLVAGGMTMVIEHEDGAELPDNACAVLDPAVTL